MAKKVAFIRVHDDYDHDYEYEYIKRVFEGGNLQWEEVTDEEFAQLMKYKYQIATQRIVFFEQSEAVKNDAFRTVHDIIKAVERHEKAQAEAKAKRAAAAKERKLKKLAKDKAAREELYNQLKEEFNK